MKPKLQIVQLGLNILDVELCQIRWITHELFYALLLIFNSMKMNEKQRNEQREETEEEEEEEEEKYSLIYRIDFLHAAGFI